MIPKLLIIKIYNKIFMRKLLIKLKIIEKMINQQIHFSNNSIDM